MFAYILLLASSIIYTIIAPAEYHIAAIGAGTLPAPSTEELDAMIIKFFHLEFAVVMLFWACLYSVKFSFLFLFRLIIDGSSKSLKAWDAVAAVLVLSYLASMSVNFAECGPADHFAVGKDLTLLLTSAERLRLMLSNSSVRISVCDGPYTASNCFLLLPKRVFRYSWYDPNLLVASWLLHF